MLAQSLAHQLERLHAELPPQSSVLFGDLSTSTVLRAVGGCAGGQEAHDTALALAVECFCEDAEDALSVSGKEGAAPVPMRALRIEAGHVHVIHRGGSDGLDAVVTTLPASALSADASSDMRLDETLDRIRTACATLLSGDD